MVTFPEEGARPSEREQVGVEAEDLHHQYRVKVRRQLAGWFSTNATCIGVWLALGSESFWPIWPFVFTTVGLCALLIRGAEGERERQESIERKREGERRRGPGLGRGSAGSGARHAEPNGRALLTVLFIDIVDSTGHAAMTGDAAWARTLDRYERLVIDAVTGEGGRVVKLIGDGALATFAVPGKAIAVAEAIRSELRTLGHQVRAGVHTGEVEVRGSDIAGIAVHTAQRVCAAAEPDEILVTSTVVDLVAGAGLVFEDRGPAELKGMTAPVRLAVLVS